MPENTKKWRGLPVPHTSDEHLLPENTETWKGLPMPSDEHLLPENTETWRNLPVRPAGVSVGSQRQPVMHSRIERPYVPPVSVEHVYEGFKKKATIEADQTRRDKSTRSEREIENLVRNFDSEGRKSLRGEISEDDEVPFFQLRGLVPRSLEPLDHDPGLGGDPREFPDDPEDDEIERLLKKVRRLEETTKTRWGIRSAGEAENLYLRMRTARKLHDENPDKFPPVSDRVSRLVDEEDANQEKMERTLGRLHEIDHSFKTRAQLKEKSERKRREKEEEKARNAEAEAKRQEKREKAKKRREEKKGQPKPLPRTFAQQVRERRSLEASLRRLDRQNKKLAKLMSKK
jgi:hypothetical protein